MSAREVLNSNIKVLGPMAVSVELGVNNAHVYVFRKDGSVSPTLRKALIEKGWIPQPPPYRYFKIRRDDHRAAAEQIITNMGIDYADHLKNTLGAYIMGVQCLETRVGTWFLNDDAQQAAKRIAQKLENFSNDA